MRFAHQKKINAEYKVGTKVYYGITKTGFLYGSIEMMNIMQGFHIYCKIK